MLFEHIHVRNFKSIKEATLNLEPLTVIVGANAAGKSNIINVFRFISILFDFFFRVVIK